MKRGDRSLRVRLFAIAFTLVMCFSVIPFLGDEVYAAETAPMPNYDGAFTVYPTYFNYYPFTLTGNRYSGYSYWSNDPIYMEYSTDGVTWNRTGKMQASIAGPVLTTVGFVVGGLSPNTAYHTRIYYGDDYGNRTSPYRNTGIVKTGKSKKPAIKKVTAKAVNVKRRKSIRPGYYYWTGYSYIWTRPVKMKYYTYNVKVTVRLKKKPGTAGIWVNGRWLKGNKKKYTTTFKLAYPYNMSAKKPRGRVKYTVTVQTGQSSVYGGYSPAWKKRMKLK